MGGEMDVLQGTLDVMVLKALTAGPQHGYNILAWIRAATNGELRIEDAALYPALHRLEARGFIESEWGLSENNRRAKFYHLTSRGRKKLGTETASWHRYAALMARLLDAPAEG